MENNTDSIPSINQISLKGGIMRRLKDYTRQSKIKRATAIIKALSVRIDSDEIIIKVLSDELSRVEKRNSENKREMRAYKGHLTRLNKHSHNTTLTS